MQTSSPETTTSVIRARPARHFQEEFSNAFSAKWYDMVERISEANQWTLDVDTFLQIFPAEVWTKIFEKCPSDVVSALSSKSPLIRKWVFLQRTSYLFPQVWNILHSWYAKNIEDNLLEEENHQARQGRGFAARARYQEQRYDFNWSPHIARQNFHETLKLRLVCKNWRTGVDQLYSRRYHMFNDSYDILEFENTFMQRPTAKPPKRLSRSIVIGMLNSDVSINNILRFIGSSVWYCKIKINDLLDTEQEKYFMLRQALELMPNLRDLEVTYENPNWNKSSLALEQLVDAVAAYPLKKLESLARFTTDDLPYPIFNEMLKKNNQIPSWFVVKSDYYDIAFNGLKKVEENLEEFVVMCDKFNMVKLQLRFENRGNVLCLGLSELQRIIQKHTWISLEMNIY